eukprot:TRINITY_DN6832_c0_g3_i1.p1 TRINITY_DN6832_c0_g3~~TRINITY_DN6832_c0_g3_i1.p1  ORF type:complete len:1346 (-),score=146.68 TRINITY_DN6832_c0_g3_i1:106-4143(-)
MGAALGMRRHSGDRSGLIEASERSLHSRHHDPFGEFSEVVGPEEKASLLSRMLFLWAFPIAYNGFRRGRTDFVDLPPLPRLDEPIRLQEAFRHAWRRYAGRRNVLMPTLLFVARRLLLQCFTLELIVMGFKYIQPILLQRLLQNLETGRSIVLSAVLLALTVTGYWMCWEFLVFMIIRCDLRIRNVLMHFTYRKGFCVAAVPALAKRYAIGQLQNHMATDSTKSTQSWLTGSVTQVCESLTSICLGAVNLCLLLGAAAGSAGTLALIALIPLGVIIGGKLKKYTRKVQESRDQRGRVLFEFFSNMRVVKCFTFEGRVEAAVSAARREELRWQWRRGLVLPIADFIASSATLLAMAVSLSWYTLVSPREHLTPSQAFSALAWMNILGDGLKAFPFQIAGIIDAYVSFMRLERLFCEDTGPAWLDISPHPELPPPPPAMSEQGQLKKRMRFSLQECVVQWENPDDAPSSTTTDTPSDRRVSALSTVFPQGLSLDVMSGDLLLVCGPIGCGESTLLSVLAGIVPASKGQRLSSMSGPGACALVTQRPWLLNGSLRENIVFGLEEDTARLEKVLNACSLHEDLSALADGLDTLVGEEGVQLSGGQRQRVSLARALYSGADAYLLDDVFSALDAHVGSHVWEEAICGLLKGRTRVVITHQVHFCKDPRVDKIVLLSDDGSCKFMGSYAELEAKNLCVDVGIVAESSSIVDAGTPSSEASFGPTKVTARLGVAPEISESREFGNVRKEVFLLYARSCGGLFVFLLIAVPISCYYVCLFLTSWELAQWTDGNESVGGKPSTTTHSSMDEGDQSSSLTRYLFLVGLTCAFRLCFSLSVQLSSWRSARNLYQRLMSKLLRVELSFFEKTPTGQILNRCLKDVAQIDDTVARVVLSVIQAFLDALTVLLVLAAVAPWSLAGVPPFCIGYAFVMKVYRWPARDLKRLEALSRSPVFGQFSDTIKGSSTILTYGHEERFVYGNLDLCRTYTKCYYTYWAVRSWNALALELLGSILLCIAAVTIAVQAASGKLPTGVVGLALNYALNMPRQLMWISIYVAQLETEFVAIERIAQYLRLNEELVVQQQASSVPFIQNGEDAGLEAVDVWFKYDSDGPYVLQGLCFKLPVGARAAIVGRTGSGKSSIVAACLRLYSITSGAICIGGRNISSIPLPELRSTVRVLLQDPILFKGTIRSNLLLRQDPHFMDFVPSDARVWNALEGIGLDRFIRSLGGLDAIVDEAGNNFSHGQRQILCVARSLLDFPSDAEASAGELPRYVLCDEPTSSCDPATDAIVHKTLLEDLPPHWTLAVVCHRLHRIRSFDRALVVDAGKVVESGLITELLKNGGLLRDMCNQQGCL